MRWIIFRQDDNRIAVIDDERYRVFTEEKGNIGELLIDSPNYSGNIAYMFFLERTIEFDNSCDVRLSR